ncbi:MAG TPA: hypothetical protein VMU02_07235 [bacterium]|nr:hypothetical protein [bacterium]
MAYSDNVKRLAVYLCRNGRPPNSAAALLSSLVAKSPDKIPEAVLKMAAEASIPFGQADWDELKVSVPTATTIRSWVAAGQLGQEADSKEATVAPRVEPVSGPMASSTPDLDICSASPEGVTVTDLETLGIPRRDTSDFLREWWRCHRSGWHDVCERFLQIKSDIMIKKMPPGVATSILDRYVKAAEFEMPELAAEADLVRALEPWRGRQNTKATLEELEERAKPSEARLDHLQELAQLLTEWKDQLDAVLSRKDCVAVSSAEGSALFQGLLSHCPELDDLYGRLVAHRAELERAITRLARRIAEHTPSETEEDFLETVARACVAYSIRGDLPSYRRGMFADGSRSPNATGVGDIDRLQTLELDLVRRYRRDGETKKAVAVATQMLRLLRGLQAGIGRTLQKRDYTRGYCRCCPD